MGFNKPHKLLTKFWVSFRNTLRLLALSHVAELSHSMLSHLYIMEYSHPTTLWLTFYWYGIITEIYPNMPFNGPNQQNRSEYSNKKWIIKIITHWLAVITEFVQLKLSRQIMIVDLPECMRIYIVEDDAGYQSRHALTHRNESENLTLFLFWYKLRYKTSTRSAS